MFTVKFFFNYIKYIKSLDS